jgi:2-polyprenyl-3-methyl-5-hydroxy-6-metoxy-1,4-benzoquinol methylase
MASSQAGGGEKPAQRTALKKYDDLHAGLTGKRVVVVGCSDGSVTPLARRGVYVEETDISTVSLEKLQRAIDREGLGRFASTRVMNAENLEYADGSLDAITCSGVLRSPAIRPLPSFACSLRACELRMSIRRALATFV